MKNFQLSTLRHGLFALLLSWLVLLAVPGQAQVTLQQITNGLVSYYPLDQLAPRSTNVTPDLIYRRDMTMYLGSESAFMNGPASIVAGSHPGMGSSTAVMSLSQTPAATVLVYAGTGFSALTGQGDFLPFINQRGATMNFWIKGVVPGQDQRVMAECAQNGSPTPFFSLSTQPSSRNNDGLGYFLRATNAILDPNGVRAFPMFDGTWELPIAGNGNFIWVQSTSYTTNVIFDNNWHMLTTIIETNGDLHVFVDGNYDPGVNPTTDNEGNPAMASPIFVTNVYYTTNNYPLVNPPVTNPPPNGFVRWIISGLDIAGATTAFGGFDRNHSIAGGPAIQLSDIGFWNRPLQTNEIQFVMTNGISGVALNSNAINIVDFSADFKEVGTGHSVKLNWTVIGANSTPGGIVINNGVGDVSSTFSGSTIVTLGNNATYTFVLTAHNGYVADKQASVTVQTFAGVSSNWNLIQRFDGVFGNTTTGINGNGWVGLTSYYAGGLDRFNVVTVNSNKALSPRSGYLLDTNSVPFRYDTAGALAYGMLNGLTIPPFEKHTLFFRFSLRDPASLASAYHIYSGLDFKLGVTDYSFATGPLAGANPPNNYTAGPGIHISRYDPIGYTPVPFDLEADNFDGTSVVNSYSYIADPTNGSASGLLTNVTYYCWLDVSNDNTMENFSCCPPVTNTINEPVFGLWLQSQGQAAPVQLFSGYGGDRDFRTFGCGICGASPNLTKVYVSVGTENFTNGDYGAFFETNNMLLLDDFYLTKTGYDHTIPRLFQIASIVRGSTNATISWYSLGSLFQINTYTVQRKLNLADPVWTTLTNGLPSGGDLTSFTDNTVGSGGTAFYRIGWP